MDPLAGGGLPGGVGAASLPPNWEGEREGGRKKRRRRRWPGLVLGRPGPYVATAYPPHRSVGDTAEALDKETLVESGSQRHSNCGPAMGHGYRHRPHQTRKPPSSEASWAHSSTNAPTVEEGDQDEVAGSRQMGSGEGLDVARRRSRARIAMTGDEGRTIEGRTTPTTANATAGDERRATERRRPTDDDRRRPTIEEDAQDDRRSKGRRGDEGRGHRRRRRRRGAGRPAAFPRLAPPRGRARLTTSLPQTRPPPSTLPETSTTSTRSNNWQRVSAAERHWHHRATEAKALPQLTQPTPLRTVAPAQYATLD